MTLGEVSLLFDDAGLEDDMTIRQGVEGDLRCLR